MTTTTRAAAKHPPKVNRNVERREASIDSLLSATLRLFVSQGYRSSNLRADLRRRRADQGRGVLLPREQGDGAVEVLTHRDEVLLLILMSLEFKQREGEVNTVIASLYRRQRELIEGLIASGQKSGRFAATCRPSWPRSCSRCTTARSWNGSAAPGC